ncbi:MAG TPA: response regulator [Anaerolineae bacterium]|nr:response regulator [Anaerolineae bacterium]
MEKESDKQKVLIIDDRRENIVFLANNILRPKGYDIITAMDGEKGLHKALEERPDLIIMDLRMPRMNGLEVLSALREEQCHIPVILTTFHGSESVVVEAFRLGVKDYVIKPYTVEDMEEAIKRALGEGRAEDKVQLRERIRKTNQQWERRVRELSTLHDIGKAVTSLLDLEKIVNRVVEAAVFLTGAEEGFLLLIDQGTKELYMRAAKGLSQREARSFRVKVDDSLSGQVITTGKPIMVSSVQDQEKFKLKTGYLVKSLLHVPLKLRNEIIGVLSVHNRISSKAFTDNDLRTLTILAGHAAVAIENARLYQSMEEKAQQLSQILSTQKGKTKGDTNKVMQLVRGIEIHEQRLKKSREEAEQLTEELRALVAAAEDLVKRLKVQEKEAEELAEGWRT